MMKKTKGLIFCIICTLLCAGLSLPVAAEIKTDSYEQTVTVLQRVGVLESSAGAAEDAVSRAEFTAMAIRMMGVDVTQSETVGSGFTDVPDAHPYASAVKAAREFGLISGNGNTMFYPDSKISYQEAGKILVAVTGYQWKLSDTSLTSYMAMANQIGIMRGVGTLNYSMAARRDVLYKMIENALDVEILKQIGFGDEVTYESKRNETVLSENLKVGKYKGMVTATPYTSYNGTAKLKTGQIEIDGEIYTVNYNRSAVENLLGYQVTYYVDIADPTDEEPTVLLIVENMAEDRVLRVKAEDIKPTTTNAKLCYYSDSGSGALRSESADITATANVIYNGVYTCKAHMLEANELQPMTGGITLLDTDGDGNYDLVKIDDVTTVVAESVNAEEQIVTDYYKRTAVKVGTNEDVRIVKNGAEIDFADLKAWDVLAVREDKGKTKMEISVTSSKISGKITGLGEDTVTVEEREVELAESLKTFLALPTADAKYQLTLNTNGNFYFDEDGKIAAADVGGKSGTGGTYAYLIKYGMESGISTNCEMKVLVKSNEILTLKTASKLTVDGKSGQSGKDLYEQLEKLKTARPAGVYKDPGKVNNLDDDGKKALEAAYTKQNYVIVYKTNDAGEVTEVDTVIANPEENGLGLEISYPAANKRYKSSYKFSDNSATAKPKNFIYSGSTIMFNVPTEDDADEKNFTAVNDFTHDAFFRVAAYDRVDGQVSVVCNFLNAGSSTGNDISSNVDTLNTIGIVKNVTSVVTEDGERVAKIYLVNGGKEVSYTVIPDKTIPSLQYGDVMVYHVDSLSRIDAIKVLFQPTETTAPYISGAASKAEFAYGMVYEKFPDVVTVMTDQTVIDKAAAGTAPTVADLEPYMVNSFLRIYLVDMEEEEIRLATTADIFSYENDPENASMMFMKLYYDIPKEAVIYKWK